MAIYTIGFRRAVLLLRHSLVAEMLSEACSPGGPLQSLQYNQAASTAHAKVTLLVCPQVPPEGEPAIHHNTPAYTLCKDWACRSLKAFMQVTTNPMKILF